MQVAAPVRLLLLLMIAMPVAAPPAKRAKLSAVQRLMHVGNISNQGLDTLFAELRRSNLDLRTTSSRTISEAFHDRFDSLKVVVVMAMLDGTTFDWEVLHPGRLVVWMLHELPALASIYAAAMRKHKPSISDPWTAILIWDEYTPGDKLRVDNTRKGLNFSLNFAEVGPSTLSNNYSWFTFATIRSSIVHMTHGGTPAYLREVIRLLMLGSEGLACGGFAAFVFGEPCLIHARLGIALSDGDGIRDAMNWKGHNSLKPRWLHHNIVEKGSGYLFVVLQLLGWRVVRFRRGFG